MHLRVWISLAAFVGAATAAPLAVEGRAASLIEKRGKDEPGIYVYYAPPKEAKREADVGIYDYYAPPPKDKREADVGIYDYYAPPPKDKREADVGIYDYYAPPPKDRREAQDFEDQVARNA